MKIILHLLLWSAGWASPIWIPAGSPVPPGLVKKTVNVCCGSMRPALNGGEVCWVEIYREGVPLQVGDIVGTPEFTHRITAMNKRAVYTAGDANRTSDGWTLKKDILYVIRFVERAGNAVR